MRLRAPHGKTSAGLLTEIDVESPYTGGETNLSDKYRVRCMVLSQMCQQNLFHDHKRIFEEHKDACAYDLGHSSDPVVARTHALTPAKDRL